jgi:hypothetical protein
MVECERHLNSWLPVEVAAPSVTGVRVSQARTVKELWGRTDEHLADGCGLMSAGSARAQSVVLVARSVAAADKDQLSLRLKRSNAVGLRRSCRRIHRWTTDIQIERPDTRRPRRTVTGHKGAVIRAAANVSLAT